MNTLVTILSAVLVFGFLIFIHEAGHFLFARLFGVTVKEFSVGMGPRLLWYDSKKSGTRYSLSMLPIGGFVAMAGEDEASDDPNAFDKKPAWQRFVITAAGAGVNIVVGFLAMIIIACGIKLGGTTVYEFVKPEGAQVSSSDYGLQAGDTIVAVGDRRVHILDELSYEIMRQGTQPVDLTVLRDGEEHVLRGVVFPGQSAEGQSFGSMDFKVGALEKSVGTVLSHAFRKSVLIVRMCWESLFDLLTGRYSFAAVSGPVGISGVIGDAARAGFLSLLYVTVLISINLGVMNLIPFPALDGGRLITLLFEMITRKKVPAYIEGWINSIGLILLLGLSVVVLIKDVVGIFL